VEEANMPHFPGKTYNFPVSPPKIPLSRERQDEKLENFVYMSAEYSHFLSHRANFNGLSRNKTPPGLKFKVKREEEEDDKFIPL
jgi:hypothetical protein